MKYIVEVNAKYLVSVEAESALSAEHAVLDLDGIWGALAFDREAMKTDTFAGAVQGCEMVSMKELETMSEEYRKVNAEKAKCIDEHATADEEVKRLEEMLELAKQNRAILLQNIYNANKACAEVYETLGYRNI